MDDELSSGGVCHGSSFGDPAGAEAVGTQVDPTGYAPAGSSCGPLWRVCDYEYEYDVDDYYVDDDYNVAH